MKLEKKLNLKKQTIENLSTATMSDAQGGGACQYPTRKIECETYPRTMTCGGGTCFCMSIQPV